MTQHLTIGEAAKAVGLSVDAIRFYEREGVLLRAHRTSGGRRLFSSQELMELSFIARLRRVRMPLPQIARYLALARQGEATLPERLKIIADQRLRVLEQIAGLRDTLGILDFKLGNTIEFDVVDRTTTAGAPEALAQREDLLKRRALRLVSGAKSND
jgi:DNA-binding transcriptional MerR regulator